MLGLNHITAPVDFRDKAYFSREEARQISDLIIGEEDFHEVVVVSTCNRSEIYVLSSREDGKESFLEDIWSRMKNLDPKELNRHSYYSRGMEAVGHLFRVVSSLDSMVVGENQILGQVKEAYQTACENDSVDYYFNYLFQAAFRIGKRVRAETNLNEGAVSISYAAVELAKKVLGKNLSSRVVGVLGTGEMGEMTAFHLNKTGISKFVFINRSLNRAEKLAARFGGDIYQLDELNEHLWKCDIVVSCTSASKCVVTRSHVESAIKNRGGQPMFLIDIAAPRDIEESVQDVKDTFLFTIDDLKKVVGENQNSRQEAASNAMDIIEDEVQTVHIWHNNLSLAPVIKKLSSKYKSLIKNEIIKRTKNQPDYIQDEMMKIGMYVLKKILHVPIDGMKKMGENGLSDKAGKYAEQIFGLKDETD